MAVRRKKVKGSKRVSYQLIDRDSVAGAPVYKLLRELVDAHHSHLKDARIALAWCTSWKPDRDGRVTLGKCVKATDLHRELAPFDFVILLKHAFWYDQSVKPEQRRALLDHELCHAGVMYDDRTGDPVHDERGRVVYRMVKHDIEEFSAIAGRYGCWKRDIEQFYAALNRSARAPWQPCAACRDTNPGWVQVEIDGVKRMAKCECLKSWAERRAEAVPA